MHIVLHVEILINAYTIDIKYDFKFDEDSSPSEKHNKDDSQNSALFEGSFFRSVDKQNELEPTGTTKFNDCLKDGFDYDDISFKIDENLEKS
jgi:hypothetical protein